ncbi:MAG: hypothetical protein DHS80DRAFT_29531 [Piptocephalis tieghemiana]|nr:MAG: hypothetical protein DHS80DRAFT_29531 [Piptocephalis tieghemiana]
MSSRPSLRTNQETSRSSSFFSSHSLFSLLQSCLVDPKHRHKLTIFPSPSPHSSFPILVAMSACHSTLSYPGLVRPTARRLPIFVRLSSPPPPCIEDLEARLNHLSKTLIGMNHRLQTRKAFLRFSRLRPASPSLPSSASASTISSSSSSPSSSPILRPSSPFSHEPIARMGYISGGLEEVTRIVQALSNLLASYVRGGGGDIPKQFLHLLRQTEEDVAALSSLFASYV